MKAPETDAEQAFNDVMIRGWANDLRLRKIAELKDIIDQKDRTVAFLRKNMNECGTERSHDIEMLIITKIEKEAEKLGKKLSILLT